VSENISSAFQSAQVNAPTKRIPELDGLRGLAILLVIICHYIADVPHGTRHSLPAKFAAILGQGSTGVDLFFILSGFLIGGILLGSRASPNYYQTFYLRRLHRIIPIYYGWILLFGLLSVIARNWNTILGTDFKTLTPYWAYFLFLQNYFDGSTLVQAFWLIPTWSLCVEEQFYLLAPPIIRNLSARRVAQLMAAVIVVSFLLRVFLSVFYGASHDYWGVRAAYAWTPCRADDLALGVLAAIAWRSSNIKVWIENNVRYFYATLYGCAVALAALMFWLVKPNSFVGATIGRPVYGAFYSALLMILLVDRAGFLAKIFRWGLLRELGKVSYCVYIIHEAVHWAVFRFVGHGLPQFTNWRGVWITLLAFAVSVLLAEISWRYFENPLIHCGHRYSY
jgi:peptidoglycan/LPS O-acetylase OafA/YrhL